MFVHPKTGAEHGCNGMPETAICHMSDLSADGLLGLPYHDSLEKLVGHVVRHWPCPRFQGAQQSAESDTTCAGMSSSNGCVLFVCITYMPNR